MGIAEKAKGIEAAGDGPGGDGSNQYSNRPNLENRPKAKDKTGYEKRFARLKRDHPAIASMLENCRPKSAISAEAG